MNKSEIISNAAKVTGYNKKDVAAAYEAIVKTITDALIAGDEVSIAGFGKFKVNERAAREGRNPSTGEIMQIPATKTPSFKASLTLKNAIKGA